MLENVASIQKVVLACGTVDHCKAVVGSLAATFNAPWLIGAMTYVPTIAKATVYTIMGVSALRKGNDALTWITGENLILDVVFFGNEDAYDTASNIFDVADEFLDGVPEVDMDAPSASKAANNDSVDESGAGTTKTLNDTDSDVPVTTKVSDADADMPVTTPTSDTDTTSGSKAETSNSGISAEEANISSGNVDNIVNMYSSQDGTDSISKGSGNS